MATKVWLGGSSAVTQVDHLTPGGTIEADDRFIVTMTDENGTTASIDTAAGGSSVGAVCSAVQAALDGSSNDLFQAVTWTEDGSKIIGTAKVSGVPFYCTVSTTEAGGGAADDQTFVRSSNAANAGPNDWNTAANWSPSGVPSSADDIRIIRGSHSILYGLETAGSGSGAQSFDSFIRNPQYTGNIGDVLNGFYLMLDSGPVEIDQAVGSTWLWGDLATTTADVPGIRIRQVAAGTEVRLRGGTIGAPTLTSDGVRGTVRIISNTTIKQAGFDIGGFGIIMSDCPQATLRVDENVSISGTLTHRLNSGTFEMYSGVDNIDNAGATINWRGGNVTGFANYSGTLNCIGAGNITGGGASGTIFIHGGTVTTRPSEVDTIAMETVLLTGGVLDLTGTSVTNSNAFTNIGGTVHGTFD